MDSHPDDDSEFQDAVDGVTETHVESGEPQPADQSTEHTSHEEYGSPVLEHVDGEAVEFGEAKQVLLSPTQITHQEAESERTADEEATEQAVGPNEHNENDHAEAADASETAGEAGSLEEPAEITEQPPVTAVPGSDSALPGPPPLPSRENVPEPDAPPLPPRKRQPFFWLPGRPSGAVTTPTTPPEKSSSGRSVSSPAYDLILQRLDATAEGIQAQKATDKDATVSGIRKLQQSFNTVKAQQRIVQRPPGATGVPDDDVDWEFWSLVVNDYANVARNSPEQLRAAISSGFPPQLRGLIWQLIASSKSSALEEVYQSILKEPSPHEKAIKRDLSRTSFFKSSNSDSLFSIIKGYSLFDPEVGYTQGMAFIAMPLLLNMMEAEAFTLLVHLMKDYGFRSLFVPEMPGLHLRLYQFDRMLEDLLPSVHMHLARQGVRSSMYASQWFLTLFAYKFPLPIVMRVYDIVIAEGMEAILKFGVALIKRNRDTIVQLEFDAVLTFLKEKIFDVYLIGGVPGAERPQYEVNRLVADASQIQLLPITLRKYENEYTELHRIERERVEEVETLRQTNGQLVLQVRRLETNMAALNKEHIEVANEMVQGRLEAARLQDENEQLQSELAELRAENEKLAQNEEAQEKVNELETQNAELVETKERLENQLTNLENDLLETKQECARLEDSNKALSTRWSVLRKHIADGESG